MIFDFMLKNDSSDNKNTKYKLGIKIFIILCLIILVVFILLRIFKKKEQNFMQIPTVNITYLENGDLYKEIDVIGTVSPIENSEIVANISGTIKEVYVRNGDEVKDGTIICYIDNKTNIDSAKNTYEQSLNTFNRYENIYKSGNLSKQNYEQYKNSYIQAKNNYEKVLENSYPESKLNGRIDGLNIRMGQLVQAGETICYINNGIVNDVKFGVSERVLKGINIGDIVKMTKNGVNFEGRVVSISRQINKQTGQYDVSAIVSDKIDLPSGTQCKCTFTYERKENINFINRKYVYYENQKPFIYTIDNENKIKKIFFDTGIETDENLEVISGLDINTKIISTWNSDLAEGSQVLVNDNKIYGTIVDETDYSNTYEFKDLTINIKNATDSDVIKEDKVHRIVNENNLNESVNNTIATNSIVKIYSNNINDINLGEKDNDIGNTNNETNIIDDKVAKYEDYLNGTYFREKTKDIGKIEFNGEVDYVDN